MPENIYVTCVVAQELFESEYYITVKDSSVYVDRVNVKVNRDPINGDEVEGKVVAYLVEEKSDQPLIELPGEPVVGSLRAWAPKADSMILSNDGIKRALQEGALEISPSPSNTHYTQYRSLKVLPPDRETAY